MSGTTITCPECRSVLKSAKPIPAGGKIRCPTCDTVFSAPPAGADFGEEESSPRLKRPARVNGEDEWEHEEDDRIRLRRRRRKSGNQQWVWLFIGIGGFVFLLLVGGGIAAVVWLGHNSRNRANAFALNEAILNANRKLQAAGVTFGTGLAPLRQGQEADAKVLRSAQQNALKVLADVQAEMKAVKVPPVAEADHLYQAHQQMLQNQEKIIKDQFGEIIRVAEDKNLSPAQKWQKITAVFVQTQQLENSDLAALRAAQKRLADKFNVELRFQ